MLHQIKLQVHAVGDAGVVSASCPLQNFINVDPAPLTAQNIQNNVAALQSRQVSADLFYREITDRFQSVSSACNAQTVNRFEAYQSSLAERVGQLSVSQIETQLRSLLDQAYVYSPQTREMELRNPAAKQQLDLWIGLISYRAIQDENFLNNLRQAPEINILITLNSPHLTTWQRAILYNFLITPVSERSHIIVQLNTEIIGRTLNYIEENPQRYLDSGIFSAHAELSSAWESFFPNNNSPHFSLEDVRVIINHHPALALRLGRIQNLSLDEMINRSRDIVILYGLTRDEATKISLRREQHLLSLMAGHQDPSHYFVRVQEGFIPALQSLGMSREDAVLYFSSSNYLSSYTRLDDYSLRLRALVNFKSIYRQILTQELNVENLSRYGAWASHLITRTNLSLEDLRVARTEVEAELASRNPRENTSAISWNQFINRNPNRSYYYRPAQLGTATEPAQSPFRALQTLRYQGETLRDLANRHISRIIVTPANVPYPESITGISLGVLGIIILSGDLLSRSPGFEPAPFRFLSSFSHEIGHQIYMNSLFTQQRQRIFLKMPNERCAYTVQNNITTQYVQSLAPLEQTHFQQNLGLVRTIISYSNSILGFEPNDFDCNPLDTRLQVEPRVEYNNNPAQFIRVDRSIIESNEVLLAPLDETQRDARFETLLVAVIHENHFNPAEEQALRDTIHRLEQLRSGDISESFPPQHPVFLLLAEVYSHEPQSIFTFTQQRWNSFKRAAVAHTLQLEAYHHAFETRVPQGRDLLLTQIPPNQRRQFDQAVEQITSRRNLPLRLTLPHPLVRARNYFFERAGLTSCPYLTFENPEALYELFMNISRIS